MRSIRLFLPFVLVTTGCARAPAGAPAPRPEATSPAVGGQETSTGSANWSFSPGTEPQSYITTESTTVQLESVLDSSTTQTAYTLLTKQADGTRRVQGTIDRITVRGQPPTQVEILPFAFTGNVHNGGLLIDSVGGQRLPSVPSCDSPAMNRMAVIRRNLFPSPSTLARSQTWTDSSTVPACSGTIPVQLTSVRSYRVLGESGGFVTIERRDRTVASGEGAQGQHRVTLNARSTGSARLQLDRTTGEVVSSSGTSQTEVEVGSSGRLQRFVQTVRDQTTRR